MWQILCPKEIGPIVLHGQVSRNVQTHEKHSESESNRAKLVELEQKLKNTIQALQLSQKRAQLAESALLAAQKEIKKLKASLQLEERRNTLKSIEISSIVHPCLRLFSQSSVLSQFNSIHHAHCYGSASLNACLRLS